MKERPILFSCQMVRAILNGRKTQTRRVIKPQPEPCGDGFLLPLRPMCPYGWKGDILWVRETFCPGSGIFDANSGEPKIIHYKASPVFRGFSLPDGTNWKPSIHMPRKFARIFLKITNVRIERVHEITGADLFAEGIKKGDGGFGAFENLWNSINEKRGYGWDTNPYVWVIDFEVIKP